MKKISFLAFLFLFNSVFVFAVTTSNTVKQEEAIKAYKKQQETSDRWNKLTFKSHEKLRQKEFEIISKMGARINYECGDINKSRCWAMEGYEATYLSPWYNEKRFRDDYKLTSEETTTADKLKPYMQDYINLEKWLQYDEMKEDNDEMKKNGYEGDYTRVVPPTFSRPLDNFMDPKEAPKIEEPRPSTTTLQEIQPEDVVATQPKPEKNSFSVFLLKLVNWFKNR